MKMFLRVQDWVKRKFENYLKDPEMLRFVVCAWGWGEGRVQTVPQLKEPISDDVLGITSRLSK